MSIYSDVGILSTGIYLPQHVVAIKDIKDKLELSDERVSRLGTEEVHVASSDEHATDLAIKAGRDALERGSLDPKEIDLIIFSYSGFPDYLYWTDYGKIQSELGAVNATAVRMTQSSSVQLIALEYACAKIQADQNVNTVLILSGDTYKEPQINRWFCSPDYIFGDAGSAAIIRRNEHGNMILKMKMKTDGSLNYLWKVKVGGLKAQLESSDVERGLFRYDITQSFAENLKTEQELEWIYSQMQELCLNTYEDLLASNRLNREDINWVIFNNLGLSAFTSFMKKLQISFEKTSGYLSPRYGFTGASDILLNLHVMQKENKIKKNDKVALLSLGAGCSCCGAIIEY